MIVWSALALTHLVVGYLVPLLVTVQKLSAGNYVACRKWLLFWVVSTLLHEFVLPVVTLTVGQVSTTLDQSLQIGVAVFLLLPSFGGVDKIDVQVKKHHEVLQQKFAQHSQKAARNVLLKSGLHTE